MNNLTSQELEISFKEAIKNKENLNNFLNKTLLDLNNPLKSSLIKWLFISWLIKENLIIKTKGEQRISIMVSKTNNITFNTNSDSCALCRVHLLQGCNTCPLDDCSDQWHTWINSKNNCKPILKLLLDTFERTQKL